MEILCLGLVSRAFSTPTPLSRKGETGIEKCHFKQQCCRAAPRSLKDSFQATHKSARSSWERILQFRRPCVTFQHAGAAGLS